MKKFILPLILCGQVAFAAANPQLQYQIQFVQGSHDTSFGFTPNPKGKTILNFRDDAGRVRKRQIVKAEMTTIQSDIANLVWQSEYRGPAAASNRACHPYAKIRLPGDNYTVCVEDKVAVARTQGMFIRLQESFRK